MVVTSNIKPGNLYLDGLNRQLFIPFIELLLTKMNIYELASSCDYRLSKLAGENLYSWPLNTHASQTMDAVWNLLTDNASPKVEYIELKGRQLIVNRAAKNVARFHFDQLCRHARGVSDYLAIANRFQTVMIDEIPILDATMRNEAKRFILLIDVLYDNHCHLIVTAQGPPGEIYAGKVGREAFEFGRTVSRLIEMQSTQYNEL